MTTQGTLEELREEYSSTGGAGPCLDRLLLEEARRVSQGLPVEYSATGTPRDWSPDDHQDLVQEFWVCEEHWQSVERYQELLEEKGIEAVVQLPITCFPHPNKGLSVHRVLEFAYYEESVSGYRKRIRWGLRTAKMASLAGDVIENLLPRCRSVLNESDGPYISFDLSKRGEKRWFLGEVDPELESPTPEEIDQAARGVAGVKQEIREEGPSKKTGEPMKASKVYTEENLRELLQGVGEELYPKGFTTKDLRKIFQRVLTHWLYSAHVPIEDKTNPDPDFVEDDEDANKAWDKTSGWEEGPDMAAVDAAVVDFFSSLTPQQWYAFERRRMGDENPEIEIGHRGMAKELGVSPPTEGTIRKKMASQLGSSLDGLSDRERQFAAARILETPIEKAQELAAEANQGRETGG